MIANTTFKRLYNRRVPYEVQCFFDKLKYYPIIHTLIKLKDYPLEFQQYYKYRKYFKFTDISKAFDIYFEKNYETIEIVKQEQYSFDNFIYTICRNRKNQKIFILTYFSGCFYLCKNIITLDELNKRIQLKLKSIEEKNNDMNYELKNLQIDLYTMNKVKEICLNNQ